MTLRAPFNRTVAPQVWAAARLASRAGSSARSGNNRANSPRWGVSQVGPLLRRSHPRAPSGCWLSWPARRLRPSASRTSSPAKAPSWSQALVSLGGLKTLLGFGQPIPGPRRMASRRSTPSSASAAKSRPCISVDPRPWRITTWGRTDQRSPAISAGIDACRLPQPEAEAPTRARWAAPR